MTEEYAFSSASRKKKKIRKLRVKQQQQQSSSLLRKGDVDKQVDPTETETISGTINHAQLLKAAQKSQQQVEEGKKDVLFLSSTSSSGTHTAAVEDNPHRTLLTPTSTIIESVHVTFVQSSQKPSIATSIDDSELLFDNIPNSSPLSSSKTEVLPTLLSEAVSSSSLSSSSIINDNKGLDDINTIIYTSSIDNGASCNDLNNQKDLSNKRIIPNKKPWEKDIVTKNDSSIHEDHRNSSHSRIRRIDSKRRSRTFLTCSRSSHSKTSSVEISDADSSDCGEFYDKEDDDNNNNYDNNNDKEDDDDDDDDIDDKRYQNKPYEKYRKYLSSDDDDDDNDDHNSDEFGHNCSNIQDNIDYNIDPPQRMKPRYQRKTSKLGAPPSIDYSYRYSAAVEELHEAVEQLTASIKSFPSVVAMTSSSSSSTTSVGRKEGSKDVDTNSFQQCYQRDPDSRKRATLTSVHSVDADADADDADDADDINDDEGGDSGNDKTCKDISIKDLMNPRHVLRVDANTTGPVGKDNNNANKYGIVAEEKSYHIKEWNETNIPNIYTRTGVEFVSVEEERKGLTRDVTNSGFIEDDTSVEKKELDLSRSDSISQDIIPIINRPFSPPQLQQQYSNLEKKQKYEFEKLPDTVTLYAEMESDHDEDEFSAVWKSIKNAELSRYNVSPLPSTSIPSSNFRDSLPGGVFLSTKETKMHETSLSTIGSYLKDQYQMYERDEDSLTGKSDEGSNYDVRRFKKFRISAEPSFSEIDPDICEDSDEFSLKPSHELKVDSLHTVFDCPEYNHRASKRKFQDEGDINIEDGCSTLSFNDVELAIAHSDDKCKLGNKQEQTASNSRHEQKNAIFSFYSLENPSSYTVIWRYSLQGILIFLVVLLFYFLVWFDNTNDSNPAEVKPIFLIDAETVAPTNIPTISFIPPESFSTPIRQQHHNLPKPLLDFCNGIWNNC